MSARMSFFQAVSALVLFSLLYDAAPVVRAQGVCMTFAQARQTGLIAGLKLRPAAAVKSSVEARTGGNVVSFLICPGPTYRLTVMHPNGTVMTVTEPAQ